MKTTEQISVELFIRQEAEFKTWVKSYYEGAFYLDWFKKEMGDDWFADWMGKTFRPDQIEVIGDMIYKLHHTDTGIKILEFVKNPDEFYFPE